MIIKGRGEMDIQSADIGTFTQAAARCLVDRGYNLEDIRKRLLDKNFVEQVWWDSMAGPAIDALAEQLGLAPFPGGKR